MKIICSGRCTGKTTRLIKESNKTGQYILVSNKIQADVVAKLARKLELNIPYPITVHEMMNNRVGGIVKRRGVLVDEAQHILEKVLDSKISVMTINAEETDDEVKDDYYEVKLDGGYVRGRKSIIVLYESVGGDIILREMVIDDYEESKRRVPSSFWLTESQIKHYDKRMWTFARKVDAE